MFLLAGSLAAAPIFGRLAHAQCRRAENDGQQGGE